ncbi:MAG: hypothetical protein CVT88_08355 [Candidatus Altiarchaeales archaeon HGW-Altiarchaeales-1]|nr:MAG: hypothetical protein CVT88_08355 [Candidatus Altiarchaeales archaeon HGW-Altiarchaeales-1]
MAILYVDNFRGFRNTFIQLKDINFLVGENSTGKTSILSLINILSNPNFWITGDFSTEEFETDLGYFDEIVSKKSDNKNYFKVGIFKDISSKKDENESIAILMKFKEKKGVPIIEEVSYLFDDNEVQVIITSKGVKYKASPKETKNIKNKLSFFETWIANQKLSDEYFEELSNKGVNRDILSSNNGAGILLSIILSISTLKKKSISPFIFLLLARSTWIGPIRAKPEKIYGSYKQRSFSSEGRHIPYLLKEIIAADHIKLKKDVTRNIENFGKNSGLFDKVGIKSFGDEKASPFELDIYLGKEPFKISNVGYGVSQVLPVLVETLSGNKGEWFEMQQPEIHLHPKAQAAVGELFFNANNSENKKFIIETHSDYILDRFRYCVNRKYKEESNDKKINAQVLFFERTSEGNRIHSIEINENGAYDENQPKSFREFFITEELKLIRI